jgi:Xaa-Pro dipeptidase
MTGPDLARRDLLTASLATTGAALLGCAGSARSGARAPHAATAEDAPVLAEAGDAAPGTAPAANPSPAGATAGARFSALTGFCDGITPPDEHERGNRRERGRAMMREAGIAALIIEAGTSLFYFTGMRWWPSERPLLYVLPARGEPAWIGPAFEEGTLRQSEAVRDAELRVWQEHENPYVVAAQALVDRGVRTGRVAVDPEMRWFVVDGLRQARPGLGLGSGAGVINGCRMIKSSAELVCLRRANEATKAALKAVAPQVQAGMRQSDVAALVRESQEAAGLTGIWSVVLFGPDAAYPHGTRSDRALAEGDLILVDTGGTLHGYCSDITRTWAFGAPDDEQRRAWQTVADAQQAAMARIRPGVRCSEVDAAARAVVAAAGHGGDYQSFTHRLGHGIGLNGHEHPYLVRGNDLVLAPGMTMSNEPGLYLPGRLGVRIEDIIAVTDDGVEVFGPRAESIEAP